MSGSPAVVIGAGITGLVAARDLALAGRSVTVVDPEPPGGKLRTSPFAGRLVDEGADAFLLRVPWARDLCAEVGLDGELVHPAARTAYLWSRGRLRPMPPQLMGVPLDVEATAASGVLSDEGLTRLLQDLELPASHPTADTTIGSVVAGRLGDEALDRLVDPLVGGINAGDTRRLSLAAVVPQLDAAARDRGHASLVAAAGAQVGRARAAAGAAAGAGADEPPVFAAPRSGMGRLVDALQRDLAARGVEIATERAVAVEDRAVALASGRVVATDAVVVAVPAWAAAGLVEGVAPVAAAHLAAVEHASVAIVTVSVHPGDLGRPLDASGLLVPRVEGLLMTACSWASAKWAHLSPEHGDGTVVLRASVGRAGDDRAFELDDADLVAAVLADLERTMALAGPPAGVRVSRWPASFPQYAPGHLSRVDDVEADLADRAPWVAVAGAALRGVGVPACIASAHRAVERLVAQP
ncbi:MAG: protoporphyrinogen oxidase [Actinobacteria bacterium]|nr:protoporphyrinogen oxidase [Actinomycetota bacterium]